MKKAVITMSTLGSNGRFGNQIFQYAFLRICAKHHNSSIETPPWIGQYLFGHNDPPITDKLPLLREEEISQNSNLNLEQITRTRNSDLYGYFLYHTDFYRKHQEFFCSLFQPTSAIKLFLEAGLNQLKSGGNTIIGIHIRHGDFGTPPFFIAPTTWYRNYLNALWHTLKNPILFIASDEPEKILDDFMDYNPVTSKDLSLKLPQASFYPDFYILSKCDILLTSNSTFSFAASMLNEKSRIFARPYFGYEKLIPFDPWSSQPLLFFKEDDIRPDTFSFVTREWEDKIRNEQFSLIENGAMSLNWYGTLPFKALFAKLQRNFPNFKNQ
jgi:Glycosyl transferase family 11